MNHIRRICRSLSGLPRRAGLLIATAAPAVLWADPPLPPGWNKYPHLPTGHQPTVRFPPSRTNHPPPPAHVHPLAAGGTPGWQLTLMAVTVLLLVATVIAAGYPSLSRPAAGERMHRRSDDHIRRCADPQGQPQGERPHLASRPGRNSFANQFIQDIATATSVAPGQNWTAPSTTMPQRRIMHVPWLRPRTVQLCIHCRQNPAGFWVSHTRDQTARRPWCLSCCQELGQTRYHVIPFDRHHGAGRFQ